MNKIGFAMFLIGCGGLAEGYGKTFQIIASIALAGIGILLMRFSNEKNNRSVRTSGSNILDRLRYLPR